MKNYESIQVKIEILELELEEIIAKKKQHTIDYTDRTKDGVIIAQSAIEDFDFLTIQAMKLKNLYTMFLINLKEDNSEEATVINHLLSDYLSKRIPTR